MSKVEQTALATLLVLTLWASAAHGARYNSNWQYRKQLTIDHTEVGASLTNFPVLVSLSSDSDLAAQARSDGYDILFTSSDGTTRLDHEIESYTTAAGQLVAWVKIPSLSSTADTAHFSMFTLGRRVSTEPSAGGGSGGGACFIGTAARRLPWHKLLIALGIAGFAVLELLRRKKTKSSDDLLEIDDDELLAPDPGRDAGAATLPPHSEVLGFEDLAPGQTSQSVTPPQA